MVVSCRLNDNDAKKFKELLRKSQLNKAEYLKKCILGKEITVSKDLLRDQRIYSNLYNLKSEIENIKKEYTEVDLSKLESGVYSTWRSMLNS